MLVLMLLLKTPMKWIKCCLLGFLAVTSMCHGAQWFVAPNPTPGGNGTRLQPWSLQTALTNSLIQPGETVWLRGGTYFPDSTNAYLNGALGWGALVGGTSNNPVTYRSYRDEWAVVDRGWVLSSYIRFQDLEFYDSLKGHNPTNSSYPNGPWVHFVLGTSVGDEWINCVVHDVHNAWASFYSSAIVRGCIIWYVGWNDFEHVFYPDPAIFSGSICAWPLNRTLNNSVGDIVCNSNIVFGSGATTGGTESSIDISGTTSTTIIGNVCYNPIQNFSITANAGSVISSNICIAGLVPINLQGTSATFQGNAVYNAGGNDKPAVYFSSTNAGSWSVDYNSYYTPPPSAVSFANNGQYGVNFAQWQATNGFDLHGTTNNTAPPDAVRVIPNQDQPKRCHIAVLNWTRKDNVTVNLSGVLNAGDAYKLYSAQNYNGGVIRTGTYNGTSISVPMTNLTTAPILYGTNMNYLGETFTQPASISPEFAAFVVIGSSTNAPRVPPAPPSDLHTIPR